MDIERIDLYHVAMPLISPWRTAYGEDRVIESVLVKITSGDRYGWGETCPLAAPTYGPEFAAGAFQVLKNWLAPRLIGRDIRTGDQISQLLRMVKGNPFAKAGLDLAWWDLHARQTGQPLYRSLGGRNPRVTVGADFGVSDSIDSLLHDIRLAVAAGFPRIKLKFRPGWDLAMVRAVRQEFPDLTIHVDCNGGYGIEDSAIFEELDELQLAMIEQPLAFDDIVDHAVLQDRIRTPICLDESITGFQQAKKAIALGACQYINIKPGRVGGLTVARDILALCREKQIGSWIGSMLESALGASHCLALATLPGVNYPADLFPSGRLYKQDICSPEIFLDAPGVVVVSEGAGVDTVPDHARLMECTVDHAAVVATS